ncbi:MAG: NYN domain-containing protein [Myxococcales bacterium]|nr:NYN domain-containing protein [Myxococcales bacterium]
METNLAVLIDFENIAAGTEKEGLGRFDVDTLMRHIKDKGRILVARSYADWGRFSRFKQSLLAANVTMMELTSHGMQDKNRADIAMVVDALELAFTKDYIDTYVVVSGDSDFTPMVLKMRELNKRVIGIGTRKSTSRLLIQACDEFNFYDTVVQPKQRKRSRPSRGSGSKSNAKAKAFDLLEEALDGLQRENPESPLASVVKSAMLRKSPDFAEHDLGYSSFARFLEEARDGGLIRLSRDRKSGGYRVDSADSPDHDDDDDFDEVLQAERSEWIDEYLPDEAKPYVELLQGARMYPFAAPTRLAVLEALEQVVAERKKRRRKTTLKYVTEDIQKKLRRTHPDMPVRLVKGLLEGLLQAGELIHRDGTAIRSNTAAFTLTKDAEALNQALVKRFLRVLKDADSDLTKTGRLAELMYGDRERRREIEETLAYLEAHDEPLQDTDLDDLLVADGEEAPAGDALDDLDAALMESEPEPEPAKKPRRRSRKAKEEAAAEEDPTEEAPLPVEAGESPAEEKVAEEKPKRRSRSRKAAKPEPEIAVEPAEEAEEPAEAEEEAPKPRVRRRAKKAVEAEPAEAADAEEPVS